MTVQFCFKGFLWIFGIKATISQSSVIFGEKLDPRSDNESEIVSQNVTTVSRYRSKIIYFRN